MLRRVWEIGLKLKEIPYVLPIESRRGPKLSANF